MGFCKIIKEKGLLLKLDTNGTNYKVVKNLIENKLVDYVAMDIKAPFYKYKEVANIKGFDFYQIKKTIDLLVSSDIDYEFRTVDIDLLNKFDKKDILNLLPRGSKHIFNKYLGLNI